jgi:uncharacterized RDD family membrane protein YckC
VIVNRPPTTPRAARPTAGLLAALAAALLTAAAAGQAVTELGRDHPIHIAATDDALWLAAVGVNETRLFERDRGSPFAERSQPLKGHVEAMTAADRLYVLFDDRSLLSFAAVEESARLERAVPDGILPVDLLARADELYALVTAGSAAAMTQTDADGEDTAERDPVRPDADDPRLWLAVYAQGTWTARHATPALAPGRTNPGLRPRLAWLQGALYLFWLPEPDAPLQYVALDQTTIDSPPQRVETPPLRAFWPLTVNTVPTLALVTGTASQEDLRVHTALGQDAVRAGRWSPVALNLALPPDVRVRRHETAFSHNQHLGLAVTATDGAAWLCFARLDGPSREQTIAVAAALAPADGAVPYGGVLQTVLFVVLMACVVLVFTFRRSSLTVAAALPLGTAPALISQRILAGLIDLVPITLIVAIAQGLEWSPAIGRVVRWAFGSDTRDGLPAEDILIWWTTSIALYAAMCLVLESLTQRTLGKAIARIRVTDERGQRPHFARVLARNLLRCVELLPPLWLLAFMLALTPNRQRLGDILARTLVLRGTPLIIDPGAAKPDDESPRPPSDTTPPTDEPPPNEKP